MSNPYVSSPATLTTAPAFTPGATEPRILQWNGRIGRLRYFAYSSLCGMMGMTLSLLSMPLLPVSQALALTLIFAGYAAMLASGFVQARRRLQDLDQPGWMAILLLIPFLNMVVWAWLQFASGSADANRFGLPPAPNSDKVVAAAVAAFIIPALAGILMAVAVPALVKAGVADVAAPA
ncbi:DUF805 domain-containing protein [Zemynaea arenosa]|uniref:DUF805 domain-containing protein n=1 Tax=Zemynaea arenosa TaxID=2561931 RepID=UPI001431142F|nr:DUF805 domain-containing protein [Massilia arenosa]